MNLGRACVLDIQLFSMFVCKLRLGKDCLRFALSIYMGEKTPGDDTSQGLYQTMRYYYSDLDVESARLLDSDANDFNTDSSHMEVASRCIFMAVILELGFQFRSR